MARRKAAAPRRGKTSIASRRSRDPAPPTLADGRRDPDEERTQEAMDQALEDSFPASDPPGHASPSRTGTASRSPS